MYYNATQDYLYSHDGWIYFINGDVRDYSNNLYDKYLQYNDEATAKGWVCRVRPTLEDAERVTNVAADSFAIYGDTLYYVTRRLPDSPDGWSYGDNAPSQLYRQPLAGGEPELMYEEGGAFDITACEDGIYLCKAPQHNVRRLNTDGTLTELPISADTDFFSYQGKYYAIDPSYDLRIAMYDMETHEEVGQIELIVDTYYGAGLAIVEDTYYAKKSFVGEEVFMLRLNGDYEIVDQQTLVFSGIDSPMVTDGKRMYYSNYDNLLVSCDLTGGDVREHPLADESAGWYRYGHYSSVIMLDAYADGVFMKKDGSELILLTLTPDGEVKALEAGEYLFAGVN